MLKPEDIIDRAVQLGDFGPGSRSWRYDESKGNKGDHFATSVDFIEIKSGDKKFAAVAKVQPRDAVWRNLMHSDEQFSTEYQMYGEILPLMGIGERFPRMYYGCGEGDPDKDCILLEDWTPLGYKVTEERVFLDLDHVLLGVTEIAKFHAASIRALQERADEFTKLTAKLKFTPFGVNDEGFKKGILLSQERGLKPLCDLDPVVDEALSRLKNESFMDEIMTPQSPWTVLCHGDCNRNNMLFTYSDRGRPLSCALFDFQLCRMSSPVVDLAFFLYLNTSTKLRSTSWDTILHTYWRSLKESHSEVPTYDSFLEEFAKRAIYGYYLCAYFLPVMMFPIEDNGERKSPEEEAQSFATHGGEEANEAVIDIAKHLLERKYLHAFVRAGFVKL